ncbi:monovalent cation:H+ antiporter, CPA1 (nhx1) [Blastocladiella emersonii ATCC 22665]|nr:monovalent cation:H+ antiporter, CPA1 (nhx1) [Blastocladiella emersonii ATCC 22665]
MPFLGTLASAAPTESAAAAAEPDPAAPLPEEEELLSSRALLVLVSLLMVTLWASYVLQRHRIRIIHESVVALVLGSTVGLIVRVSSVGPHLAELLSFKHTYFFNLILPPIILHSGYQLREGDFFGHLGPIATFAFAGTFTSIIAIGIIEYALTLVGLSPLSFIECLLFGCILSSTDPVTVLAIFSQLGVDARLYSVIFGESLLNDSVAIVMFSALNDMKSAAGGPLGLHLLGVFVLVFAGSLAIGVGIGLAAALLLKHTDLHRFPGCEACLVSLLAYTAFLLAQAGGLSGIVSLLFAGITLKHYAYENMSRRSQLATTSLFATLSQLSETFIFIQLGISLFTTQLGAFSVPMILVTFFAILVARYVSVFPFAALINAIGRRWFPRNAPPPSGNRPAAGSMFLTTASSADLHHHHPRHHPRPSSWRNLWNLLSPTPSSAALGPDVIPRNHQIMLWWAGLRGAVSFALALEFTSASSDPRVPALIQSTTLVIVLATVVIFGGTVPQALAHFNIKSQAVVDSVFVLDDEEVLPRLVPRASATTRASLPVGATSRRGGVAGAGVGPAVRRSESIPLFGAAVVEQDDAEDSGSDDNAPPLAPLGSRSGADPASPAALTTDGGGLFGPGRQRARTSSATMTGAAGAAASEPAAAAENWFLRLDRVYLKPFFSRPGREHLRSHAQGGH